MFKTHLKDGVLRFCKVFNNIEYLKEKMLLE